MDGKKWYTSKTLWANALALIGMVVQGATGSEVFNVEAQAGILAFINVILRLVTKEPVTS